MLEETIKSLTCQTLKIRPEVYSEELGAGDVPEWDSLGHMNLLMATERHFGIAFDVGDSIEIETIGDLVEMVRKYTASGAPPG
ncbi:MAG: acyl carrier protein [Verrucomicrobia bacterium]|nr:acyl carrier protein [Verrucomicrobiota bacterium]